MEILLDLTVSDSLLQLALILFSAKLAGFIFDYFKQPRVLGELSAGLVLGANFLNLVNLNNETILFLAEIGIIMLFFDLGMKSHAKELLENSFHSFIVAFVVIVSTVFLTVSVLMLNRFEFGTSLFIGMVLAATGIGITTRTLIDAKKLKTREGTTVLISAMIVDLIVLIFLSVTANAFEAGKIEPADIARTMIFLLFFVLILIFLGKFMRKFISFKEKQNFKSTYIVSTFIFAVLVSFAAKELGLLTIMGAFAAGLVLERGEKIELVSEKTHVLTDVFTPIFYVVAGATVSLQSVLIPEIMLLAAVLTLIAVTGKLVSGFGVWNTKISKMAVSSGMLAGGGVGLTFASFGLKKGIFVPEVYSAIVVVLIITTFLGAFLMRKSFEKIR